MNSAAAHSCRKRQHADAHEGFSSPLRRRRRLTLVPNLFPAVRSFALRTLSSVAPHKRRRLRHLSPIPESAPRPLSPIPESTPRPLSPRVALATAPRRHRKLHFDDARHAVSAPRRRRSLLPSFRHFFPVFGPFSLHFLLKTGALAPRRGRKPAKVDMGNRNSQPQGKSTSDGVSEAHTKRIDGKKGIFCKALQWAKKCGGRLQESGFQKPSVAELPSPLDSTSTPNENLSELFTPLSDKDEREVDTLLYNTDHSGKVIVMHEPSNIEITIEKLRCLRPGGWLNDEVINLYIELLKEREEREHNRFLKCHFFNSFFYSKLTCGIAGYDYQSVRRWTTFKRLGYGLVECEKIFVPVHRNVHWCLVVINMKDKTLQYLDSLGGLGHDVLEVLTRYIVDELKDKSNLDEDPRSWVVVSESLPLQQNGWDCGMFMLKYIDFHSRGFKPSFSQKHMRYFRNRTAKEIMTLRAD